MLVMKSCIKVWSWRRKSESYIVDFAQQGRSLWYNLNYLTWRAGKDVCVFFSWIFSQIDFNGRWKLDTGWHSPAAKNGIPVSISPLVSLLALHKHLPKITARWGIITSWIFPPLLETGNHAGKIGIICRGMWCIIRWVPQHIAQHRRTTCAGMSFLTAAMCHLLA